MAPFNAQEFVNTVLKESKSYFKQLTALVEELENYNRLGIAKHMAYQTRKPDIDELTNNIQYHFQELLKSTTPNLEYHLNEIFILSQRANKEITDALNVLSKNPQPSPPESHLKSLTNALKSLKTCFQDILRWTKATLGGYRKHNQEIKGHITTVFDKVKTQKREGDPLVHRLQQEHKRLSPKPPN